MHDWTGNVFKSKGENLIIFTSKFTRFFTKLSSLDQFPNYISLNRPQFAYDKIFLKLYYPFKNPTTRQFQNNTYDSDWVTFSANGQKWQKRHLKMAVSLWWGHSPLADVTAGANFCQGYWFRIWYFEKMTETNSIYRWISHMKVMTKCRMFW